MMAEEECLQVAEDIQPMNDILAIRANDLDSEQNARLTYRLSGNGNGNGNDDKFDIHPVTGNIFVKGLLDRETIAEYRLIVIASDHGKVRHRFS